MSSKQSNDDQSTSGENTSENNSADNSDTQSFMSGTTAATDATDTTTAENNPSEADYWEEAPSFNDDPNGPDGTGNSRH